MRSRQLNVSHKKIESYKTSRIITVTKLMRCRLSKFQSNFNLFTEMKPGNIPNLNIEQSDGYEHICD